ncbi:MAG: DUF6600 domain-containing protein [Candidatus Korobacteraceae bacterium]
MKSNSGTTVAALLALMLFGSALVAQQTFEAAQTAGNNGATTVASSQPSDSSFANSQVRIVRLSDVRGEVQIDRNTGQGFEPALLNLPVTEGVRLRTGSGFAEVEFEDNSTLRLTPDTIVEFPRLQLRQSGAKASTVNVETGTVYVSLARTKGNEFTLTFADQQALLAPSNHVRLLVTPTWASLAVLDGMAKVATPAGITTVVKKKTVNFHFLTPVQMSMNQNAAAPHDGWDSQAIEYHKHYAKNSAYGAAANLSGISDMNYYGSFTNVVGCGQMWRPFFTSAAWDPFMNGTWAWYPGSGYSWVSPYPWGWMPYHYGEWEYCPAFGWGWRPGGVWVGLKNRPKPKKPPRGFPRPRPPLPPIAGHPTLVPVNRKPPVASSQSSPERFVFRKDSAGLGIPRGDLGNLSHLSGQVEQRGFANIDVRSAPMIAGTGRAGNAGPGSSFGRMYAGRTGPTSYSRGRSGASSYSSGRPGVSSYSRGHPGGPSYSSAMGHGAAAGGMEDMGAAGGSGAKGGGGGGHR